MWDALCTTDIGPCPGGLMQTWINRLAAHRCNCLACAGEPCSSNNREVRARTGPVGNVEGEEGHGDGQREAARAPCARAGAST